MPATLATPSKLRTAVMSALVTAIIMTGLLAEADMVCPCDGRRPMCTTDSLIMPKVLGKRACERVDERRDAIDDVSQYKW